MRKLIASTMIGGALFLTGCGFEWPDPCEDAPTPTQAQLDDAAAGFEIDFGDCELGQDGVWRLDD